MSGKTEFFMFMTAALATIVGLVTVQEFFLSYQDILAVQAIADAPENVELVARRKAEGAALQSGRMPISAAKEALAARGRAGFPEIVPQQSDDYSALSGWVHHPGFKAFVPPAPPPVETPAEALVPVVEAAPAAVPSAH